MYPVVVRDEDHVEVKDRFDSGQVFLFGGGLDCVEAVIGRQHVGDEGGGTGEDFRQAGRGQASLLHELEREIYYVIIQMPLRAHELS